MIFLLMNWSLNPSYLSKNNFYNLNVIFENEENEIFLIESVKLNFSDLHKSFYKVIKKELRTPLLGFFNRKIYTTIPFKIERDIVAPKKFITQLLVRS